MTNQLVGDLLLYIAAVCFFVAIALLVFGGVDIACNDIKQKARIEMLEAEITRLKLANEDRNP